MTQHWAKPSTDASTMSIRRNTAYNLLGSVIPLAVSLVTIPIYLGLIGEARYGVLAIAWLLLGYFGLFDLGLGRATAQSIAVLRDSAAAERARTFWTALAMNLGLGVIGGLLIWPIAAYFFGHVFKVDEALRPEIQDAVPWLMLAVPMATVSGVFSGALQGRERFLELNLISVSGTAVFQLLPLAVAALGYVNLSALLPAALFARLVTLLLLAWRCQDLTRGHRATIKLARARQLLRFGGWVTVSAFVGPMMVVLDRFIIGATAGAQAVTYYTVPFQLAHRTTLLSGALTAALFPRFATLSRGEELRLAQESLSALVIVVTPMAAAGILLIEPFLAWWIGPELAERSAMVGQIIVLGFWVNSFARVPLAQLQARGRPNIVATCHLAELLPYFGLLYLGLHYIGLVGAAIAFSLRVLVDYVLLSGFAGILRPSTRLLALPGGLLVAAALIAIQTEPGSTDWMLFVLMYLSLLALWAWRQAPSSLKQVGLSSRNLEAKPKSASSLI